MLGGQTINPQKIKIKDWVNLATQCWTKRMNPALDCQNVLFLAQSILDCEKQKDLY